MFFVLFISCIYSATLALCAKYTAILEWIWQKSVTAFIGSERRCQWWWFSSPQGEDSNAPSHIMRGKGGGIVITFFFSWMNAWCSAPSGKGWSNGVIRWHWNCLQLPRHEGQGPLKVELFRNRINILSEVLNIVWSISWRQTLRIKNWYCPGSCRPHFKLQLSWCV